MKTGATHNPFIYQFLRLYTIWKIKRNFTRVEILGEVTHHDLPVLIICNHISWWDGFWVNYINMKIFHRRFWFMMAEEQLEKNRFFNKTGGFPVRKGSKNIIASLRYASELLKDKGNLLLIFPQGMIRSLYDSEIRFEKGIEYIIRHTSNEIRIVFLVCLPDYLSNPKPVLYAYLKEHNAGVYSLVEMEQEYRDFYDRSLKASINRKEE